MVCRLKRLPWLAAVERRQTLNATEVILTLNEISCRNSGDFLGGTNPYIWPMLLWIDNKVNSTCAQPESFRTNLGWGMKRGQTAAIPPEVGLLRGTIDGELRAMLIVVPLLERSNSSDAMMRAAFQAYCTELPLAVSDNLAKLADLASRREAIKAIKERVAKKVKDAAGGQVGWLGAIVRALGNDADDSILDFAAAQLDLLQQPVFLGFAGTELFSYADDGTPGNVSDPTTVSGNELICQGVDSLALPPGGYELSVSISDLLTRNQPVDVDVPDNGTANVTLRFVDDPRQFVLTAPMAGFDAQIKRVLEDAGTVLDSLPATQWLSDPRPRPRRKACLMNLLAKLRAAKGPQPKTALIADVSSIFFAEVDRIYPRVSASFLANLQTLAADDKKPFYAEGRPKATVHTDLLNSVAAWEADADQFHLLSFRQEGNPSMQAVIAVPPGGDATRTYYADLDIDLGNPLQDVNGVLIHFGELLAPGKTDHLKLATTLAKGTTADFMYYKVVKGRAAAG